jgi:hypothetical protein
MKINILSKAEPAIYKAAEAVPHHLPSLPHIDPNSLHLIDPATMAATIGGIAVVMHKLVDGFSGILH